MRDLVFHGEDVAAAAARAADTLGVGAESLRYFVLDTGGVAGQEARIAVLGDALRATRPAEVPGGRRDPAATVIAIAEAITRASGVALSATVHQAGGDLEVRFSGPGVEMLGAPGGEGLRALQQILRRSAGRHLPTGRLVFDRGGRDERREVELQQLARELAAAAHRDGRAQVAPPLNAYERRQVHLCLSEEAGLRTYSEGAGAERRLIVAPRIEAGCSQDVELGSRRQP